jgi:zinc protease
MDWLKNTNRILFPNGLTLLLHPLENSEVAALHFCVKAGYFCEKDSEVGLAHLLEHMYFKGSKKYPDPGTLGIRMKALGGMINATTAYDQTNYFCEIPSENLLPALEIMTDSFAAPIFPADELTKECEVVIEEFNRKLDNPSAYSQELLIQLAFQQHRMKRWRIGTPEQLRSYTREHLFDYFSRYYQPQNMVVTVTGKFDTEQISAEIKKLLSPMKNRELIKDFGPEEPAQTGLRYACRKAAAMQSYLHFAFHAPGVTHPDGVVLEFLAFVLSSGKSARLHRHLVERKRSASAASSYYLAYEDVGLFMMTVVTEAEKIRTAGSDAWSVLQDVCESGITADELKKLKNKLRLHQAMQTEDALSLAELLSYYEAYGSYEKIREQLERMEALTSEEVVEVARKIARLENLSVMELVNADVPEVSSSQYESHLQQGFVPPETNLSPPFIISLPERNGHATSSSLPIIRSGRATYILQPDPHYPFVAAGIFFRGGRVEETRNNAGITQLLYRGALKGTSRYTSEELSFRFDSLGNPPRFSCYRDFGGFMMETLPEYFPEMWKLLLHCVSDTQFPSPEVETEKGKIISNIRRNMDDNFVRPVQLFHRAFFGDHPYALPETGLEESILPLEREELLVWKKRLWNTKRAIICIVGDVDPEETYDQLEKSLEEFPVDGEEIHPPPQARVPAQPEDVERRAKKQTAFCLGFPSPPAGSGEGPKYDALQQVLSGMGGRLFLNVRSKKALAYTVHASAVSALYGGAFVTYIAGEASKEAAALEAMWHELDVLKKEPVTKQELENARNALIGNYTLYTQTASARALDYTNSFLLNRPLPYASLYRERVNQVTEEDLLRIASITFNKENSTIGIVRGTTDTTDAENIIAEGSK